MDSEKTYIEYLSSLNDEELEKETQEIYDDCVFYDNCDECIHNFLEFEKCYCRLNCINYFNKERRKKDADK
ncbi:MAG: hypothetical protein IKT40_03375 [Bacilli bacterium]|nr:hypothetical protein [Bacilli bacterium]